MPSQKIIEATLADEIAVRSELRALIAQITEQKRFEWTFEGVLPYPNLASLGVVEVHALTIRVCPGDYLAYGFMMTHDPRLLADTVDLRAVVEFERHLREQLRTNPIPTQLFRVTERISRLWVKSQNIDYHNDLTVFSAAGEGDELYRGFVSIFCDVLPELILTASALHTHVQQFIQTQRHLPPLIQALETYCQRQPDLAAELYAYAQQHPFEGDIHLRMAAQSALNRHDWEGFWPQLMTMSQQADEQVLALSVMFRAQICTDQQANQYLDLALSCNQQHDDIRRHVASVVQQILRFPQVIQAHTITRCFCLLHTLAQSETSTVQGSVLHVIWLLDDFIGERFAVLMTLLRNPELDAAFRTGKTNTVDTLLSSSFNGCANWFAAFDEMVEQKAGAFKSEDFMGSLHNLAQHFGDEFMSQLRPRLIHRQGSVRQAANQILGYIEHHTPHLRFSVDDLHQLSPLQQYRLWLVINESFYQPAFTIPLLLPLFDTKDELVAELITCQLQLASENYMGQVLDTLESVCQPDNPRHQRVRQRVNAHFDAFLAYRQRKSVVNELNPQLTQHTLFQQFDDLRRISWNERMQQTLRTGSIASLFKEVLLSKGGGWRNSKTGVTSQLGHVQTTVSLPRFYFLRPHEMDFDAVVSTSHEEWADDVDLKTWITRA